MLNIRFHSRILVFVIASLAGCIAQAQSAPAIGLTCAATAVKPGSTLACSLVLSGGNTSSGVTGGPSALQGVLTVSQSTAGLLPTFSASGPAVVAGKTISVVGNNFLLAGFNQSQMADGIIATINVPIPANATCAGSSTSACFTIGLTSINASTPQGTNFAITINPSVSVSVNNPCDVNGDGQLTSTDFTAERQGVQQSPVTAGMDRNGDSASNAVDVQIVINSALGLGCTATQ